MSSPEPFKTISEQVGGAWLTRYVITCCECDKCEKVNRGGAEAMPDSVTAKRFERLSWEIGPTRRRDTCPACVAARRVKPTARVEGKVLVDVKPRSVEPAAVVATPKSASLVALRLSATTWASSQTGISPAARRLLFAIAASLGPNGDCVLKREELSRLAESPGPSVTRDMLVLKAKDLITRQINGLRGGGRGPTIVRLNMNPKQETSVTEVAQASTLTAVPPRQITVADRRKVLDEIETQWNHDQGRYRGAHCDKSIASSLDVPRKWVSDIREEFFGAEKNDAQYAAFAKLSDLIERADKLEKQGLDLATEAEAMRAQAKAALVTLGKAA